MLVGFDMFTEQRGHHRVEPTVVGLRETNRAGHQGVVARQQQTPSASAGSIAAPAEPYLQRLSGVLVEVAEKTPFGLEKFVVGNNAASEPPPYAS
jgi:hypothetical protein